MEDMLKTKGIDALALENACLRFKNTELRKKIGLRTQKSQRSRSQSPPRTREKAPKDPKKIKQCQRIVGELAFQLDRRILSAMFPEQQRLYGYHVSEIEDKILKLTSCPLSGGVDEDLRDELNTRYHALLEPLKKLGYDPAVHPRLTENLVNTYGLVKHRSTTKEDLSSVNDPEYLAEMISEYMPSDSVEDILVILRCLVYLAKEDGKSLFIW